MSSISSLSSALNYTSADYQNLTPKSSPSDTGSSGLSTAPTQDSISLSPAGQAALNSPEPTKQTHAQLVMAAEAGNPVAKAKLKTEKAEEGLSTCS
jgi:hypothetical protein